MSTTDTSTSITSLVQAERIIAAARAHDENFNDENLALQTDAGKIRLAQHLGNRGAQSRVLTVGPEGLVEPAPDIEECVAVGYGRDDRCFRASGTLLSEDIVLVCAHSYVKRFRYWVVVAEKVAGAERTRVLYPEAAEISVHPDFDESSLSNDVALLRLSQKVEHIEFPPLGPEVDPNDPADLLICGYGATNPSGTDGFGTRRKGEVPLLPLDATRDVDFDPATEFVAGAEPSTGVDGCVGDSGGPAFFFEDDGEHRGEERQLVGIQSRGAFFGSPACGRGSVYVRIHPYLVWIDETITKLGGQKRKVR